MKIEVIDGAVLKDGENVGTLEDGKFSPAHGLHHKTAASIAKQLASNEPVAAAAPVAKAEPAKNPELGDLTPELIDWRKANWPEDDFVTLYPPARLRAIGRE